MDMKEFNFIRFCFDYLYISIQVYFAKYSIEDLTVEDQFLFIQHLIKSMSILDLDTTTLNVDIIKGSLERILMYPSLNLHYQYLCGLFIFDVLDISCYCPLYSFNSLTRIKRFLINVIRSLSDQVYVRKLKEEHTILLYEDLKKNHLSIITKDLIHTIFSGCKTFKMKSYKIKFVEHGRSTEFKTYKKIMEMTVYIFNKSNYLDKIMADDCVSSCDSNSRNSSSISSTTDNSETISDNRSVPAKFTPKFLFQLSEFHKLWSWFNLVYEYKFIYGDINSKFTDLKFLSKH
ncbi:hypothetical protein RF11_13754 [Thelohanellus kitauei]|uniref:Uncharacterized protein n=1 Tax=Thelohanellus kitauei TaxID=669202 RepID=A0A0C2JVN7_THEKT|nr:hypothetical protein RF11_13754 [Thelohanellus kitauei]